MENQEKEDNEMEHNQLPDCASRILESQEINDAEHDIIKGDTVGDTLYSAKWILNTLISLSKVYEDGWSDSMENDLCTLWDMTAEKDIVKFLLENDFFKMAEFTLKTSKETRLTEIIVGIIGNMCCDEKALETLVNTDELISIVFSLITSDDKETLIQVFRILQAAVWDIQKYDESLWLKKITECNLLGEAICFILKSSTSEELLIPTIDFVYLISDIALSNGSGLIENIFDIDQLIYSLCESMMEIINHQDNTHTEIQIKNIEKWLVIVFNIIEKNLLKFTDNENDEKFQKVNEVLFKILQPYENSNNLMLSEKKCLLCIQHSIKMIFSFQISEVLPYMQLISVILKIMDNLKTALTENEFEDYAEFKKLYDFIENYWTETVKIINKEQMLEILRLCDHETINNIIEITNTLSKVPKTCITELMQAKNEIFST